MGEGSKLNGKFLEDIQVDTMSSYIMGLKFKEEVAIGKRDMRTITLDFITEAVEEHIKWEGKKVNRNGWRDRKKTRGKVM